MASISIAEAKNRLSELIVRAQSGEEISVTRHGKPVARLLAAHPADEPVSQRAHVAEVFRRLAELRKGVHLEGDLKQIARDGLD